MALKRVRQSAGPFWLSTRSGYSQAFTFQKTSTFNIAIIRDAGVRGVIGNML
jgi:hypothetical protein